MPLDLDIVQSLAALIVCARGMTPVLFVQQTIVPGEYIALNPPFVEEQFIGPKLFAAHRRHGEIRLI